MKEQIKREICVHYIAELYLFNMRCRFRRWIYVLLSIVCLTILYHMQISIDQSPFHVRMQ